MKNSPKNVISRAKNRGIGKKKERKQKQSEIRNTLPKNPNMEGSSRFMIIFSIIRPRYASTVSSKILEDCNRLFCKKALQHKLEGRGKREKTKTGLGIV
jgi:hypothetical protein